MLTKVLNGCQELNGLEWRALYRTFIPRIFHPILQETIYGSISDGGRKTVCISEAVLIYAGSLMLNVLKGLNLYFECMIFCRTTPHTQD